MKYLFYLVEGIIAINLLVIIHEMGHMIAGRLFKIPVLKFCIGFGPRLLGFNYKGTDFCVAPFPLGGFVMLDRGHKHDDQSTCMDCVSPWKRVIILFSGPAANLLFVFFIFWLMYFGVGQRNHAAVVGAVEVGSPAADAGFQAHDKIVRMNDIEVATWLQVELLMKRAAGKRLAVLVNRGDSQEILSLFIPPQKGATGLSPSEQMITFRLGPIHAIEKSLEKVWFLLGVIYRSLIGLVSAQTPASDLAGPIYIFHLAGQTAASSQISFLFFLAFISASLFLFNLLPLPVLDGGQILLATLQGLRKKPLGTRSMMVLNYSSLVCLLFILGSATYNDLLRFIS